MSLAVAVPFGVGSAIVYGTSIVIQHRVAQEQADDEGVTAAGLLRLVKHPTFLLAIGGDFIGFLLQLVALSTGPVVIIQPLVVLMLPVSLLVSFLLGGHRPRIGDYLGVLAVLGGLAVFLAVIGRPGSGHVPHARFLGMTVLLVLVVGALLAVSVTGRSKTVRGAMYGAVAGIFFGTLAVMIDAASSRLADHGVEGLFSGPRGFVPIIGALTVGTAGMILTQMSFQVGALGATLPANLAADPGIAVVLGAIVLHEHIPHSPVHIVVYVLCLASVVAGAIRLADPKAGPIEPDVAERVQAAVDVAVDVSAREPGAAGAAVEPRRDDRR
ncbi:MAG: DMT family transporter [Jatrophihabitans sp.]